MWNAFKLLSLTSEHIKGPFSLVYPFTNPPNYSDNMGMSYRRYLSGERIYGCSTCKTHLATIHSMMSRVSSPFMLFYFIIVSHLVMDRLSTANMVVHIFSMACKSFTASRSDHFQLTYYFHRVNVVEGEPDDRPMTTGNHTVRDIYCCKCGTTLGWKYV